MEMAKVINLGWKEPDPDAPCTIHIAPKPADAVADNNEPNQEGNAADIAEPAPPTSSGAEI
jgi:hypothetical protein